MGLFRSYVGVVASLASWLTEVKRTKDECWRRDVRDREREEQKLEMDVKFPQPSQSLLAKRSTSFSERREFSRKKHHLCGTINATFRNKTTLNAQSKLSYKNKQGRRRPVPNKISITSPSSQMVMRNHILASEIPPLPKDVSEEAYPLAGRKSWAVFWFVFNLLAFLANLIVPIVMHITQNNASLYWLYGVGFGCNLNNVFQAMNTAVAVKRVDGAFVIIPLYGRERKYTFEKYESIAIEEGKVVFTLSNDWYELCKAHASIFACCVCKVIKRPMDGPTMAAFRKTNGLSNIEEQV